MTEAKSSAKRCKKTTFTVNQTWNSFKISQYVGMQTHLLPQHERIVAGEKV